MEKKILLGRFFKEPLKTFLVRMNEIATASRKITPSEAAIRKVEYSREHDFREGFAPRVHGLDAWTLAGRELKRLETAKVEDLRQSKIVQLREQLKAAETLVSELTRELAETDSERGSTVFIARQREIRDARENGERKAG